VPLAIGPIDQDRVKFHLGYTSASTAGAIQFGLAIPMQTIFLVDSAMQQMPAVAIPRVLQLLGILDNLIFGKLVESQDFLIAAQLGKMTLTNSSNTNAKKGMMHPDLLRKEYRFYCGLLCDTLGVPRYPFSERFNNSGGVGNGTVRRP
jgi:hypothetical protein